MSIPEMPETELYISVDVETAGPHPRHYSLLSIGACLVHYPHETFYVELQPTSLICTPEAEAIHGLSVEGLSRTGVPPAEAMTRFESWVTGLVKPGQRPVFVAFNAPFDWMFVNDYFHSYLGHNPFGHNALDIKAYFMGLAGIPWSETNLTRVAMRYGHMHALTHDALQDAVDQAAMFRAMLLEAESRHTGSASQPE